MSRYLCSKSSHASPPWNRLGAKPKRRMNECLTARTVHPEITDATGRPALPSASSSTPLRGREQPWITARGKTNSNNPVQQPVKTHNRYAPLLQDPAPPPDEQKNLPSPLRRVRSGHKSASRPQPMLTTGPQTLIVGDTAVKHLRSMCSENMKVLCFPKDMVPDLTARIPDIVASNPTAKKIILHAGMNDIVNRQSEVLKQHFTALLNTLSSLDVEVCISGPLPPVRRGAERFSRLMALSRWLSTASEVHSMYFLDNFNFFWDRKHLFKRDGLFLNRPGVKLFLSNVSFYLHQQSVPSTKVNAQDMLIQKGDKCHHIGAQPSAELITNHKR